MADKYGSRVLPSPLAAIFPHSGEAPSSAVSSSPYLPTINTQRRVRGHAMPVMGQNASSHGSIS